MSLKINDTFMNIRIEYVLRFVFIYNRIVCRYIVYIFDNFTFKPLINRKLKTKFRKNNFVI